MSPNLPATRELPAIEAALEPHVERIRAAAADAFAPNTRRAWLRPRARRPLPPDLPRFRMARTPSTAAARH